MILDELELRRCAAAGRVVAPAGRGARTDDQGQTVVRGLGRKRAAAKAVARAIDEAALDAGTDPMAINRKNGLVQPTGVRRSRRLGRGPLRPRGG